MDVPCAEGCFLKYASNFSKLVWNVGPESFRSVAQCVLWLWFLGQIRAWAPKAAVPTNLFQGTTEILDAVAFSARSGAMSFMPSCLGPMYTQFAMICAFGAVVSRKVKQCGWLLTYCFKNRIINDQCDNC